jgi:hypothetical protein
MGSMEALLEHRELALVVFVIFATAAATNDKARVLAPAAFGIATAFIIFGIVRDAPPFWLGLMDGYLYGINIKEFSASPMLTDWSSGGPATYPPYFFYIFGRLSALLSIDHGSMYAIAFVVVYLTSPLIVFLIMRTCYRDEQAAASAILMLLPAVYLGTQPLLQKPHEIWALSFFVPCTITLLSDRFPAAKASTKFALGVAMALGIGMYTPFAVGIVVGGGIACFIVVAATAGIPQAAEFVWRRVWSQFLAGFATAILPWAIALIYNRVASGTLGNVLFFNSLDLQAWFVQLDLFGVASAAVVGVGLILVITSKGVLEKSAVGAVVLGTMVFATISPKIMQLTGVIQTSPYNTLFVCFALAACSIPVAADRSVQRPLLIVALTVALGAPLMLDRSIRADSTLARSMEMTIARNKNMIEYVRLIDRAPTVVDGARYIATGEFNFLNFYTAKRLHPVLYPNHSYAAAYTPREEMVIELKRLAATPDARQFLELLKRFDIDLIMLEREGARSVARLRLVMNGDAIVNFNNQTDVEVDLPWNMVVDLQSCEGVSVLRSTATLFVASIEHFHGAGSCHPGI